MHEMAITESIFSIVMDYAKEKKATKVKKINLRIGKMTGIVEDCIMFYFETISKGTIAENAEIKVNSIPVKGRCGSCNKEFNAKDMIPICPYCSSMACAIIGGKELEVESIEVE
ncbi:MAG: hydrogenase maturation nickel metallochaperone HypA [Actinomycetia bacterium]|nr:hydrogenase maturation nickel metallochaperone HypA [Actinomycetes bacterium]